MTTPPRHPHRPFDFSDVRPWCSVQKSVERYGRGAGIDMPITPYSLFTTEKAHLGILTFQLRDYMGHATVATTQLYVHLGQEEARKVMEQTSF